MNEMTDEEIASRVQQGDTESFGTLVERYESKLRRYGMKFLSDRQGIEDLVQEVFIKAYVNIRSFDTSLKLSPWLYRIAHNEFVNALRSNSRSPFFVFDFDTVFPQLFAQETADSAAHERDMRVMLDRCLGALDPKYREPLVLHYFEEMSYQEIADILRIPTSTVGVRLNRGRAILEKVFTAQYPNYE